MEIVWGHHGSWGGEQHGFHNFLCGCNNSAPYKCAIGSFHENEDATRYADVACFKYLGIIAHLSNLSLLLSERGSFKLYWHLINFMKVEGKPLETLKTLKLWAEG